MACKKNSSCKTSSLQRSVTGVIFNEDRNQVLLIKRRDVPIWVLPGGGVDAGETPEDAILREIFEETGLIAKIERQVALYTPLNKLANYSYLFECTIVSGELTTGAETQGVRFFPLDQPPTPCFFLHQEWVEDARLHSPTVMEKPLIQITYFNLLKYCLSHPIQVLRLALSRFGIPFNTTDSDRRI